MTQFFIFNIEKRLKESDAISDLPSKLFRLVGSVGSGLIDWQVNRYAGKTTLAAYSCHLLMVLVWIMLALCIGKAGEPEIEIKVKERINTFSSVHGRLPNDADFFSIVAPFRNDLSPATLEYLFVFMARKHSPSISKQALLSLYSSKIASVHSVSTVFQEKNVEFGNLGDVVSEEVMRCVYKMLNEKIYVEYEEISADTKLDPYHFTVTRIEDTVISVNYLRDGIPNAHIAKPSSLSELFLSVGPLFASGLLHENLIKLAQIPGTSFVSELNSMGEVFEGNFPVNNSDCILVAGSNYRFFLDPLKDFSIVKMEGWAYEQVPGKGYPHLVKLMDVVMNNHIDCGNGIWIPTEIIETAYTGTKVDIRRTILVSSIEINKPISESVFLNSIPIDAFVVDDVRGICYFYENAPSIDGLLKKTVKSKRVFIYRYISVISGIALIIIVLVIKYRQYRRNKRDNKNKTEEKK